MSYTVSIQNTPWRFQVEENESVLQAALRQEIPVPWGCGEGVCGTCMAQVISGQLTYPDTEPLALVEEDAAAGKALLCVGYPVNDLLLAVPEM